MRSSLGVILLLIVSSASAGLVDFTVSIDVNPWSAANQVSPESADIIAVSIQGSRTATGDSIDFDVAMIDPASLRFGPWGAEIADLPFATDLDGDSNVDLLVGFPMPETGIQCGGTEVSLFGKTFAGKVFVASDTIATADCSFDAGMLNVAIDVDPWSDSNVVTPGSSELIPVAVYGSSVALGGEIDLDVTRIDQDYLRLGYWRAESRVPPLLMDLDGDTNLDAVYVFRTSETRVICEDAEVTLFGATIDGEDIAGTAAITTPDCDAGCHPSSGVPEETGRVKFFVDAKADFTPWTDSPSATQQAFMRDHYFRMQAYSPYFDERLEWYPNAWEYEDAYKISRDGTTVQAHPQWVLRDAAGNKLYIPYDCADGTCPQYAGDPGRPAFRSFWLDRLEGSMTAGYIGIFIDDLNMSMRVSNGDGEDVVPIDPRTGEPMTDANWQRYFAEFAEEARARFPSAEIAHNVIYWTKPADSNGDYLTRQAMAADYINLERGSTTSGMVAGKSTYGYEAFLAYIDWVHSLNRNVTLDDDDSDTVRERDFELATYFLINNGRDMLSADGDRDRMNPDNFWPGYEINLGRALGKRYIADGIFRRDFECGLVLVNQPESTLRIVELGQAMTDLAGNEVESVVLGAFEGEVLVKPCN